MDTIKDQHDDLVRLSFFTEIGKSITSAKNLDAIFKEIMKHIGNIFAPANWSLFLKEPKTGDLCFRIVVGGSAEHLQGTRIPRGKGIVGWIAENGQPLIVEDVTKDSRFDHTIDAKTNFETKSIIGVPLLSNERVFGVIELINKVNGDNFTPFDLTLLRTIADFAAIAIEKNYYLQSLKRIAHIDSLTGLYNRRFFRVSINKEIEQYKRYGTKTGLMLIDIDHFKNINDSFGHMEGDQVLVSLSRILKKSIRSADTVYRFGGDEFLIMLPNAESTICSTIRSRINKHLEKYNQTSEIPPVSVSIGCHEISDHTVRAILDKVDRQMYKEKVEKVEQDFQNLPEYIDTYIEENPSDDM